MKLVRPTVLTFAALLVGYVGGLYTAQKCSLEAVTVGEESLSKFRTMVIEGEYSHVWFENFEALRYITLLQHVDSNESKKMRQYLIGLLADSYRSAKHMSQSSYTNHIERKSMDQFIKKIDTLSNNSEVFREIREVGSRES